MKRKKHGKIDDQCEEVPDIGMRGGNTADMVSLQTFDLVVFGLGHFTLLEIFISCLSHMRLISGKSREQCCVENKCGALSIDQW